MSEFFRHEPSTQTHARPIIRIGSKWGMRIDFVVFDVSPLFVRTHYCRGRSFPCLAGTGKTCRDCEDDQPVRERAYIGGGHAGRKTLGVLELTEKAGAELAEIAKTTSLVGRVIKFGRVNDKKNGSITIEISDTVVSAEKIRAFDTGAALCAVWGIQVPGQDLLPENPDPVNDPRTAGDFAADEFKQAG